MAEMSTPLSPEQKKAKEFYRSTFITATLVASLLLTVAWVAVLLLIHWVSLKFGSGKFQVGNFSGGLGPMGVVLGHFWAQRRVRQAGLSQESETVEVVPNTASDFSREPAQWRFPKSPLETIACISFYFLMSILGLWALWYFQGTSLITQVLGVLDFILFFPMAIVALLFSNSPSVLIDQKGVVAFHNSWWRRRALWSEVAYCEMKRQKSLFGERTSYSFLLKNAQGKVLLNLNSAVAASFSFFPEKLPEKFEAIEAELKRRLSGTPSNADRLSNPPV